jgi:hypothetical protein
MTMKLGTKPISGFRVGTARPAKVMVAGVQVWPAVPEPVPWTPADLPGVVAWYDSSDLSTLTVGVDQIVTEWRAVVGDTGTRLWQTNMASNPSMLQDGGVMTRRGQNLTSDIIAFLNQEADCTVFAVLRHDADFAPSDSGTTNVVMPGFQNFNSLEGRVRGFNITPADDVIFSAYSQWNWGVVVAPLRRGRTVSVAAEFPRTLPNSLRVSDSGTQSMVELIPEGWGPSSVGAGCSVGSWAIWTGDGLTHQLCIVQGRTSAEDMARWDGWAAHKYGFTDLLPADHPYKNAPPRI